MGLEITTSEAIQVAIKPALELRGNSWTQWQELWPDTSVGSISSWKISDFSDTLRASRQWRSILKAFLGLQKLSHLILMVSTAGSRWLSASGAGTTAKEGQVCFCFSSFQSRARDTLSEMYLGMSQVCHFLKYRKVRITWRLSFKFLWSYLYGSWMQNRPLVLLRCSAGKGLESSCSFSIVLHMCWTQHVCVGSGLLKSSSPTVIPSGCPGTCPVASSAQPGWGFTPQSPGLALCSAGTRTQDSDTPLKSLTDLPAPYREMLSVIDEALGVRVAGVKQLLPMCQQLIPGCSHPPLRRNLKSLHLNISGTTFPLTTDTMWSTMTILYCFDLKKCAVAVWTFIAFHKSRDPEMESGEARGTRGGQHRVSRMYINTKQPLFISPGIDTFSSSATAQNPHKKRTPPTVSVIQ